MPTEQYAIDAFVNACQQSLVDIEQVDIDGNPISFRPNKSDWIAYGWDSQRWRDHDLPQVAIHHVGGMTEGQDTANARWELLSMQVDIMASGIAQRSKLAGELKGGFFNHANRSSLLRSGVNFNSIVGEYDVIEDEMLPQEVYTKQLTFKCYYNTSGA
ncbi:MAG: hypothetical protein ACTSQH_06960 [Candidatus Hodarchaeales archaeon]